MPTQAQAADLARIYIQIPRLVAVWVKERVLPAYERALGEVRARDSMIRDDIPELSGELDGLEGELHRLVLRLTPELRSWIIKTERWHRAKFVGALLTATTVDLSTMIGPDDAREPMEASLGRNIDLIKNLSADAKAKTADAVWRGFQARKPARDVARDIQAAMETSRARAVRIASHQTQVLSMTLDQERQTAAGITEYIWRHSRKAHPRQEHVERDGKVFQWAKPPTDGPPGTLPNCGCKAQAHITLD